MHDTSFQFFRSTLDLLNNTFPEDFWSVERLIRFSKIPYKDILEYSDIERKIVKNVQEILSNHFLGPSDYLPKELKQLIYELL